MAAIAVRAEARTTPGRIRLLSLGVVAALILAWAVDLAAISHRHHAVSVFASQSEPLVVTAQRIETELNQADASAADAFLAGGIEPADQRAAYNASIAAGATDLADAARQVGLSGAGVDAVHTIATQLGIYTGLVEQARAGNRQGFPIGAAYLRDASQLLRAQIIPAAASLAAINATRLNHAESSASALADVLLVVLTALTLLAALAAIQDFLVRRTRRALNVGLVVATIVSLGFAVAVMSELAAERSAVLSANQHGYATAAELARARALAFEAKADESQALIAQGNGQAYLDDFGAATAQVGPLLAKARSAAPTASAAQSVDQAQSAFTSYLKGHATIAACDSAGQHSTAVALALGDPPPSATCGSTSITGAAPAKAEFALFDRQVQAGLNAGQAEFISRASAARRALQRLPLIATIAAILAGLLALAGAKQRIDEYR